MIQIDNFIAGKSVRDVTGYNYFMPEKINDAWIWDDQSISTLLEKAAIKLGELNSFSKLVPNIDLFIQLHVTKEAVVSSRIEGTQTQIDEALLDISDISPERKDDWQEVDNYINALNNAIKELERLPISSRLLQTTHRILLDSVRGEHKQPGEYRKTQNWIGGHNLSNAVFIPPHPNYVHELMNDLENFLHNDEIQVPTLIKIAIAHYQFETIHPFLDGNGRIGRLLITLFLVEKNILNKPLLYLSAFFEKNKGLYYDNLTFVRTNNDMKQWLKYFLLGVAETASTSSQVLSNILELKSKLEKKISTSFGKRANTGNILLQYLLKKPIVKVNQVQQITKTSFKTANDLVTKFVEVGILKQTNSNSRNRYFIFEEYLNFFE